MTGSPLCWEREVDRENPNFPSLSLSVATGREKEREGERERDQQFLKFSLQDENFFLKE